MQIALPYTDAIDLGNPVSDHPLNRDLVSWWLPLPNNSGGQSLFDLKSRYAGTLTSGPTWAPGPNRFQSLALASNARVTTFDFAQPVITITGWFLTSLAATSQYVFGQRSTTRRSQLAINATGTLTWETQNTTTVNGITTGNTVSVGNWYWFCAMVDYPSGTKKLWVNGTEWGSASVSGTLGAGGTAFTIGSRSSTAFQTLNGRATGFKYYGRAFGDSEQSALYAEELAGCPLTLRRAKARQFTVSSGSDVTVSLTGSAVTASAGTLTPAVSYSLSGDSSTGTAGTLTPNLSYALSGSAASVSAGTLTQTTSYSLLGSAVTVSAGTLVPGVSYALVGSAVSVLAGTLSASGDQTVALSGSQVTSSAGTLLAAVAYSLSGSSSSSAAGTLVPEVSQSLSGSSVTVSAGSLLASLGLSLTGESVTGSAGSLAGTVTFALSGSQVLTAAGLLSVAVSVGLTGSAVTTATGTVVSSGGELPSGVVYGRVRLRPAVSGVIKIRPSVSGRIKLKPG